MEASREGWGEQIVALVSSEFDQKPAKSIVGTVAKRRVPGVKIASNDELASRRQGNSQRVKVSAVRVDVNGSERNPFVPHAYVNEHRINHAGNSEQISDPEPAMHHYGHATAARSVWRGEGGEGGVGIGVVWSKFGFLEKIDMGGILGDEIVKQILAPVCDDGVDVQRNQSKIHGREQPEHSAP